MAPREERRPIAPSWETAAPDTALRKTGIGLMAELPWGTHICLFYETKEDLIAAHVAYFRAGLEAHESCVLTVCPPVSEAEARAALVKGIPNAERHIAAGRLQLVTGADCCNPDSAAATAGIIEDWTARLEAALAHGFDGVRLSTCGQWQGAASLGEVVGHERELDAFLAGRPILALCTYWLPHTAPGTVADAARMHQCALAIRSGGWEFLDVPGAAQAQQEIRVLNGDLDALPAGFAGRETLTPRELIVLAQIVKGASSKQAARVLGVSHRTVEFHRAGIMKKLDCRNTADLVRRVLSGA